MTSDNKSTQKLLLDFVYPIWGTWASTLVWKLSRKIGNSMSYHYLDNSVNIIRDGRSDSTSVNIDCKSEVRIITLSNNQLRMINSTPSLFKRPS